MLNMFKNMLYKISLSNFIRILAKLITKKNKYMRKLVFIALPLLVFASCSPFKFCQTKYSEKEIRLAYKQGVFDSYYYQKDSTITVPAKYYFPLMEDSAINYINSKKHH
jgi:hypothetical protein